MRRRAQRGFTLIEMMIGVVLGSLIVMAAVAFASHEVRTLARSNQVLEITQVGRVVTNMISDDLTNAGIGVGYRPDGTFDGIQVGTPARFGGAFDTTNRPIVVDGVPATTDDLVLQLADGATASIVNAPRGSLVGANIVTCAPAAGEVNYAANERVLARDAFGLSAASYYVRAVAPTVCPGGVTCLVNGCQQVSLIADPNQFTSDAAAVNADYARGQLVGNFRQVTWFVDPAGRGRLRRLVVDNGAAPDCSAYACGGVVAEGVEALHFRMRTYDPTRAPPWRDVTVAGVTDNLPVRVDIELVMRSRTDDATNQLHDPARVLLESGGAPVCIPAACNVQTPVRREVFRASVEVKNSGYMQLTGGT